MATTINVPAVTTINVAAVTTISETDGAVQIWLRHIPACQGDDDARDTVRGHVLAVDEVMVKVRLSDGPHGGQQGVVGVPWSNIALVEFFPEE